MKEKINGVSAITELSYLLNINRRTVYRIGKGIKITILDLCKILWMEDVNKKYLFIDAFEDYNFGKRMWNKYVKNMSL